MILAPALWATWDYLRRGGMFERVDSVGRIGAFLPNAWRDDEHDRP